MAAAWCQPFTTPDPPAELVELEQISPCGYILGVMPGHALHFSRPTTVGPAVQGTTELEREMRISYTSAITALVAVAVTIASTAPAQALESNAPADTVAEHIADVAPDKFAKGKGLTARQIEAVKAFYVAGFETVAEALGIGGCLGLVKEIAT